MVTPLRNYVQHHHGQLAILTDCRHQETLPEFKEAKFVRDGLVSVKMVDGSNMEVPDDRLCFIVGIHEAEASTKMV